MKSRINDVLESFREFVTTHRYQDTPILTAYVDIDPTNPDNQRERPAYCKYCNSNQVQLKIPFP